MIVGSLRLVSLAIITATGFFTLIDCRSESCSSLVSEPPELLTAHPKCTMITRFSLTLCTDSFVACHFEFVLC